LSLRLSLLDTQLLIRGALVPEELSNKQRKALEGDPSFFVFSVASLWEVAIKRALNRPGFQFEPELIRSRLLQQGMQEMEITAAHAMNTLKLPMLHGDPFDRLLLSQARIEGLELLTTDKLLADYGNPVRLLR
jgi:PIN domain nuclease of toxin-antitoxin system